MRGARPREDTFTLSFVDLLSCMMGGAIILFLVFSTEPPRGSSRGGRSANDAGTGGSSLEHGRPAALWIDLEGTIDRRNAASLTAKWSAGGVEGVDRGISVSPPLSSGPFPKWLELTPEENEWATQLVSIFSEGAERISVPFAETLRSDSKVLLQDLVALRRALTPGAEIGIDASGILYDEPHLYIIGGEVPTVPLPEAIDGTLLTRTVFPPGAAKSSVALRLCSTPRQSSSGLARPSNVRIRASLGGEQLCWSAGDLLSWTTDGECLRTAIPLRRLRAECS